MKKVEKLILKIMLLNTGLTEILHSADPEDDFYQTPICEDSLEFHGSNTYQNQEVLRQQKKEFEVGKKQHFIAQRCN